MIHDGVRVPEASVQAFGMALAESGLGSADHLRPYGEGGWEIAGFLTPPGKGSSRDQGVRMVRPQSICPVEVGEQLHEQLFGLRAQLQFVEAFDQFVTAAQGLAMQRAEHPRGIGNKFQQQRAGVRGVARVGGEHRVVVPCLDSAGVVPPEQFLPD